ncbi:MAG: CHASE2 domain-containing protein, partial [Phycisphaerae bacterium]
YEIVTEGGYPYPIGPYRDKPTPEALLERIRKELPDRPDLSHLPRGKDLETLLQRCLAWEPDHRIASVRKLGEDITRYVYGQPTHTKPVWWPLRMRRLAVGAAARSRLAFHAVFVALCGLAVGAATMVGNVGWLVSDRGAIPSGADEARAAFFQDAKSKTLIVGIGDDTHTSIRRFADKCGLDGVDRDVRSWRAVHGELMKRLVDARPVAVVWDYYFRSDRPVDRALADGIESLERANIPVILGVLQYDEEGNPDISRGLRTQLAGRLRCGAIVARNMVRRPGEFIMAFRRDEKAPIPTLPLATYAALLHPEARLEVEWCERDKHLRLLYEIEPNRYLRRRDQVALSKVFRQGEPRYGIADRDLVGTSMFMLDPPEAWAQRTVPYEQLLNATPEELARRAGGKLVIFGDMRTAGLGGLADRHAIKYGTKVISNVPGCYLVGDAIGGLVRGAYVQFARLLPTRTLLIMVLLAAGGCWLPVPIANWTALENRSHQRVVWMGLLGLSMTCYGLMLVSKSFTAVHAVMAGFSLLAPMAGSFWVEFARNRHRVLDHRRRAIVDRNINVDGTLTLEPMPSL